MRFLTPEYGFEGSLAGACGMAGCPQHGDPSFGGLCRTHMRARFILPDDWREALGLPSADDVSKMAWIYLLGTREAVKIGRAAKHPALERFRALQMTSPMRLRLYGLFAGYLRDEGALHRRFAASRRHGEWFSWSRELGNWNLALNMATTRMLPLEVFIPPADSWRGTLF